MPQSNGNLTQSRWADHLRGCAEVANDIAKILNIHEDGARQAMFATVAIDAKNHGVFVEPVPKDSKTPVIQPETAAASNATGEVESTQKRDEAAAAKADAQAKDVPKTTTPAQNEAARRQALHKGIESAVKLLNDEGHDPKITVAGLNAVIKREFDGKANLSFLDADEMEKLTKLLSDKLDDLRAKTKAASSNDDIDW